jgi:hypothetical protein
MDLEDQHRFTIEALGDYLGEARIELACTRCAWTAEINDLIALAELEQLADEHTEVCR